MKKYRNLLLALTLFGSIVGIQTANAGIYQHCQVVRVGSIHYRWCQSDFRPWRFRRHMQHHWRPRPWRRHHFYKRCQVRITPWGRVRRCTVVRN